MPSGKFPSRILNTNEIRLSICLRAHLNLTGSSKEISWHRRRNTMFEHKQTDEENSNIFHFECNIFHMHELKSTWSKEYDIEQIKIDKKCTNRMWKSQKQNFDGEFSFFFFPFRILFFLRSVRNQTFWQNGIRRWFFFSQKREMCERIRIKIHKWNDFTWLGRSLCFHLAWACGFFPRSLWGVKKIYKIMKKQKTFRIFLHSALNSFSFWFFTLSRSKIIRHEMAHKVTDKKKMHLHAETCQSKVKLEREWKKLATLANL